MTPNERRAYAADLYRYAGAYALAAAAPGLRKDAARYLTGEADRLSREAREHEAMADREAVRDA